ncbi:MAG: uncharacterized membrane protein YhaH (DUF805 family) [Paracoccaceae bacterium]|jgi:uncharacterized membrane protein YhaH (DUF805 family)
MTFTESIQTCFKKYATFSGRASRSEFWWWALFVNLVGLVPLIGFIISIAALIPYLAVTARRLHDGGRSGWWQVLPLGMFLVMIVMSAVSAKILAYAAALAAAVSAITLLVWVIQKGSDGPNQFGDDPLDRTTPRIPGGDGTNRTSIPPVRRN